MMMAHHQKLNHVTIVVKNAQVQARLNVHHVMLMLIDKMLMVNVYVKTVFMIITVNQNVLNVFQNVLNVLD